MNDIDEFFSTARVAGQDDAVALPAGDYRRYLYDRDDAVLAPYRGMTYEEFTADRQRAPFLRELLEYWDGLLAEPFVGLTTDGRVIPDLYPLEIGPANDEGLVRTARRALAVLDDDERDRVTYPLDAQERRAWSNPEFVFHRIGLRLEDIAAEKSDALLGIVRASLSVEGWAQVDEAMQLNGFLGELTGLPRIMNHRSFWFSMYGAPSTDEPWGWQLSGHHVCVNFVTVAGRHIIAPVFIGGEPALSDAHPPLFAAREERALALASSLNDDQRASMVVYDSVLDPRMPEGRLHPADERHVAGAFRDNRVVPYEGIATTELDDAQWALVRSIAEDCFLLLRADQRHLTMLAVEQHRADTHIAWYGATDGSTPFYLRIHSPVVIAELDHHAGVWLSNRLPARFHVHTTLRLPNGNDYGNAYLAQWNARSAQTRITTRRHE
jgi:hypothetical protein